MFVNFLSLGTFCDDALKHNVPSEIGRIGIETAARILAGEEVPEEIPVQIELITRENLYHVHW